MEELMITVPYEDFVDGVMAMTKLNNIRKIVNAGGFCNDEIKVILGIPTKDVNPSLLTMKPEGKEDA